MSAFSTYTHALKQLQRDVRIYLFTAVLAGFATSGVYSVLLNIFLLRLGYDATFIGWVNAAGQFAFITISFLAGWLSLRLGTRRLILTGLACYGLGYFLLPLAEFFPAPFQSVWLLGAAILASFGGPLYWVNGNLFMMDKTTEVERTHAYSLRTGFFPLSGFFGSLVGGWMPAFFAQNFGYSLDDPAPYRFALMLGAVLFVPAFWMMAQTTDSRIASKKELAEQTEPFPWMLFVLLAIIMLVRAAGEMAARSFYNVYLDGVFSVPVSSIGLIASAGLFLAIPTALITPALTDRWGNANVFVVSMIGMGLSLGLMGVFTQWWLVGASYILLMIFAAATKPTIYVYRLAILSPVWWGAMSGTGGTTHGIGMASGAIGGGYLIDSIGYQQFFLFSAAIVMAGAIGFWLYNQRYPEQKH